MGQIPNDLRRALRLGERLDALFFQQQLVLSIGRAEAIEQELTDVGECDGVAARDALQRNLPDESTEESINRFRVIELGSAGEKLGRGDFMSALALKPALLVAGAKIFMWTHDDHVAATRASTCWQRAASSESAGGSTGPLGVKVMVDVTPAPPAPSFFARV